MASVWRVVLLLLAVLCGGVIGDGGGGGGGDAVARAREANTQAIARAQQMDLMGALALFQEAINLSPGSSEYLNNIGVTYMRLQRFDDAEKAFNDALDIQPFHQDALGNLAELKTFREKQTAEGAASSGSKPASQRQPAPPPPASSSSSSSKSPKNFQQNALILHRTRPFPRIRLDELWDPDNADYLQGRKPFVLTGGLGPDAPVGTSEWGLDYFERHFPESVVDYYPTNLKNKGNKPYLPRMQDAMRELRSPSGKFPCLDPKNGGPYVQWNMPLDAWDTVMARLGYLPSIFHSDDAWLSGCLEDDVNIDNYLLSTHWRMTLIGTRGAGMFNHLDTLRTASFQVQLVGRKRWHLCGPENNAFMYKPGQVDGFNPDYDAYPKFIDANCILDEVAEGEMMFYPQDYWHQTEVTTDLSVSVTGTLIDKNNHRDVIHQVLVSCGRNPSLPATPSPAVCQLVESRCADWFVDGFEGRVLHRDSDPTCPVQ